MFEYLSTSGEKSVGDITKFINLKQPTVSYHLKEMVVSGLLKKRVDGRGVFYSVGESCPHDGHKCIVQLHAQSAKVSLLNN
jgi:DNA-binding MarR family transcriptional regulator